MADRTIGKWTDLLDKEKKQTKFFGIDRQYLRNALEDTDVLFLGATNFGEAFDQRNNFSASSAEKYVVFDEEILKIDLKNDLNLKQDLEDAMTLLMLHEKIQSSRASGDKVRLLDHDFRVTSALWYLSTLTDSGGPSDAFDFFRNQKNSHYHYSPAAMKFQNAIETWKKFEIKKPTLLADGGSSVGPPGDLRVALLKVRWMKEISQSN